MSDDEFDDSFLLDDSFLQQVDSITAHAISQSTSTKPTIPTRPLPVKNGPSYKPPLRSISAPSASSSAGPSRQRLPAQPSSDDYGDLPIPTESLMAIDSLTSRSQQRTTMPTVIPSSRLGMNRTSSGNGSSFFQTHLNFRRENQATKGKRWDRTEFAASGRRIGAASRMKGKGKAVARGLFEDEAGESEEEEDWEPLVPGPKPLVDPTYEPQRHLPNPASIGTYIYPTNRPKRDYQFDIVQACFMDNCLVALPTGLGKTFVAGVVMLNFYRWFPTGKIVFLAPTKPLVNQQIEACQMTCGIPSKDAAVMTGQSVSAKERTRMWEERRVFYCTPQTLDNDLKRGAVDPRDIVLAVFDEAHKASGSYAYTTILAYLTAHHPYFRVLALTATPGADVERVQAVVDALHISRIEIREAEAPEIRKYMNEKKTEKHLVKMTPIIEDFRDRWAALMKPYVTKLIEKGVLTDRDLDIKRLRPFRLTAKRMEIARNRDSGLKWCYGSLNQLERMARAMGHLLEFSLGMFHTVLVELSGGSNSEGKKVGTKGGAGALRNNIEFQRLLRDVETEINCIRIGKGGRTKADRHPKMAKTLELLLEHFTAAAEDAKTHGTANDTRAMVFCSFRECVLEVVDALNQHPELLKATKFVGQSQGKQDHDKGFNQKEQKRTIADFKEGKYNILVSTSIGEEGLDIGEVDFVVIYDMPKQSIKLLQRVGRTGRKRDGRVHVLMSENREDANWDSAQQTHREIQEEILHSRNLELFEDVESLLPRGKFPQCVEQEMPVDPWDPADQKSKRPLPSASNTTTRSLEDDGEKPAKKKRRGHEVPEEAYDGFKSVAQLLKENGAKKRKGKPFQRVLSESEDESVEVNTSKVSAKSAGGKRKSNINDKSTKKKEDEESDSEEVKLAKKRQVKQAAEEERKNKVIEASTKAALDFFATLGPVRRQSRTPSPVSPSSSQSVEMGDVSPFTKDQNVDLRDQDSLVHGGSRLTPRTAAAAGFSQLDPVDLSFDDLNSSPPTLDINTTPSFSDKSGFTPASNLLRKPPLSHSTSRDAMPPPPIPIKSSPFQFSPEMKGKGKSMKRNLPTSSELPSPDDSPMVMKRKYEISSPLPLPSPELSPDIPVRSRGVRTNRGISSARSRGRGRGQRNAVSGPGRGKINRTDNEEVEEDSVGQSSSHTLVQTRGRGRGRVRNTEERRRKRKRKDKVPPEQLAEFLDLDVGVSDSSKASSDEPTEPSEDESDRLFAGKDFQPTQAPKGYNQTAVYIAGLGTQAPEHGLEFVRDGRTERIKFLEKARKPILLSSDDERQSENEYVLGSFVVDDEEIEYDTQTQTHSDALSYM
ncbi:hypothetical protein M231_03354 [Tremella mesenterica]|uniref:ATP-dependent DNA helicase n=1 Tax=Tremella mesenterica TaxID=5217 RepID=A0A4Q1BNG1_TREME|nr:hypothetical protein M231_03354 [Tremella mesenterica]